MLRDDWLKRPTVWGPKERELSESLLARQAAANAALCDNFNTPAAMAELVGVASDAFAYLKV